MIIYCSNTLIKSLKLSDCLKQIDNIQTDPFYSWHARLLKFDDKNTILLMNEETMYTVVLRNNLPRNKEKFKNLVILAIRQTLLAQGFPLIEIETYLNNLGDITFVSENNRKMTGNLNVAVQDMAYQYYEDWDFDNTIQVIRASHLNDGPRRKNKKLIHPIKEMMNALKR